MIHQTDESRFQLGWNRFKPTKYRCFWHTKLESLNSSTSQPLEKDLRKSAHQEKSGSKLERFLKVTGNFMGLQHWNISWRLEFGIQDSFFRIFWWHHQEFLASISGCQPGPRWVCWSRYKVQLLWLSWLPDFGSPRRFQCKEWLLANSHGLAARNCHSAASWRKPHVILIYWTQHVPRFGHACNWTGKKQISQSDLSGKIGYASCCWGWRPSRWLEGPVTVQMKSSDIIWHHLTTELSSVNTSNGMFFILTWIVSLHLHTENPIKAETGPRWQQNSTWRHQCLPDGAVLRFADHKRILCPDEPERTRGWP